MAKNIRSRKWLITINNPKEKGFSHEEIKKILKGKFKNLEYWCMSDEVGENGTYHTHIFIVLTNCITFTSLQNKFDGKAHLDSCKGSNQQNRDYVFKLAKWEKSKKAETNIKHTHEEDGEMPIEQQGERNDINHLWDMVKEGLSNYEIIDLNPSYALKEDVIETMRFNIHNQKFGNIWREVECIYIDGKGGSGKSRNIVERNGGYKNVYRVTDYLHPFDGYCGQDIIIFEEFRYKDAKFSLSAFLGIIDGHPCQLPARYHNRQACYTKVYVISNRPLTEQFISYKDENWEDWNALIRRFTSVEYWNYDIVCEFIRTEKHPINGLKQYLDFRADVSCAEKKANAMPESFRDKYMENSTIKAICDNSVKIKENPYSKELKK